MHNLVHEQQQDEQYAQQFFEQCGLEGTAHIGPHLNNAKRSGVLFWHRHDLQFTVYHGICTEEGVHSGRPVHHNPNHEGRVLIALGGGEHLHDDYIALYVTNPGKYMEHEEWFDHIDGDGNFADSLRGVQV